MPIRIQRGRQFAAGDSSVELFTQKGKAGDYLAKATEKLVAQQTTVILRGDHNRKITLKTPEEFKAFLEAHASTKELSDGFATKFGITFSDFVNVLDDVAAGDETGLSLDLRPSSALAKALSLDRVDGDYALKLVKDAKVNLTGANNTTVEATAAGTAAIGPEILDTPIANSWERDRAEQESWADFKLGSGAGKKFKELGGPTAFEKLYKPTWQDDEAMKLVESFALPLHLELAEPSEDGSVRFQDRDEMFRETYFDDKSGALGKAGASVRARVRFDDKPPNEVRRVLIQAKEGREIDPTTGNSVVHKFEKRFEGTYSTNELGAHDLLVTGKDTGGQPLKVAQLLYQLARDTGTLPADETLRLEPRFIVLQKRRRSHMALDSVRDVQTRRADLQKEIDAATAANTPVDPKLTAFATKLDSQVKFLEDAAALLKKYNQYMPSGECFIISCDRYSVYDSAARGTNMPTDIDDEAGRIGKGPMHVEAEWDTAASEPFAKAIAEIDKKLAATPAPANADELTADRQAIEDLRATFRKDVQTTVETIRDRLLAAGVEEDPAKLSKEQRASVLADDPNRPVFWS